MARRGGAGRGGDGCGGGRDEEEGIGRGVDVDGSSSSFVDAAVVASLSVVAVAVFSLSPLTAAETTTTAPSSAARGGSSIVDGERERERPLYSVVFRESIGLSRKKKGEAKEWGLWWTQNSAVSFRSAVCSLALARSLRSNPGSRLGVRLARFSFLHHKANKHTLRAAPRRVRVPARHPFLRKKPRPGNTLV